jgi:hypothetical protein
MIMDLVPDLLIALLSQVMAGIDLFNPGKKDGSPQSLTTIYWERISAPLPGHVREFSCSAFLWKFPAASQLIAPGRPPAALFQRGIARGAAMPFHACRLQDRPLAPCSG